MKLLIYEWEAYLQYDLREICKEKNISFETFRYKFVDKNQDEQFVSWFSKNVQINHFDAMLSINYFPLLSEICQKNQIPYIAWCYDNPLNVIDIERTLGNSVNYVVFFDRMQEKKYRDKGFDTVHYMPLGVNKTRLSKLSMTESDMRRFLCEVSLVGSLYESRLPDIKALMSDFEKGYVDGLLNVQQDLYGYYLFEDIVSDSFIAGINARIKKEHPETEFVLLKEALTFAMASEVTRRERLLLMTLMGRRFDTKLYSFQNSQVLEGVQVCPPIDYVAEMPKAFFCSKINLNPTLRCIQSGIPLRALDIMGAGGFLLSSYQPELLEYFQNEEEMAFYESVPDAIDKADFYLRHEDKRQAVLLKGRQKVHEYFSLQEELDQILKAVFNS